MGKKWYKKWTKFQSSKERSNISRPSPIHFVTVHEKNESAIACSIFLQLTQFIAVNKCWTNKKFWTNKKTICFLTQELFTQIILVIYLIPKNGLIVSSWFQALPCKILCRNLNKRSKIFPKFFCLKSWWRDRKFKIRKNKCFTHSWLSIFWPAHHSVSFRP